MNESTDMETTTLLTTEQRRAINATLSNDETSTNAEMIQYFVNEIGISQGQAEVAVAQRGKIFFNVCAIQNLAVKACSAVNHRYVREAGEMLNRTIGDYHRAIQNGRSAVMIDAYRDSIVEMYFSLTEMTVVA